MINWSTATVRLPFPEIDLIAQQRIADMTDGEDYDPDLHGPVVVVEPDDTVEQLEQALGCSIFQDPWDGTRAGDDRVTPGFEILEEPPRLLRSRDRRRRR